MGEVAKSLVELTKMISKGADRIDVERGAVFFGESA